MRNLNGLRVLVIGGSGFLGTHLLDHLSQANCELHGTSRAPVSGTSRIRWWKGTACDVDWLRSLTKNVQPNVIYQLASASFGRQDPQLILPTFEDDLRTTVNTLLVAQELSVDRVIITRSLEEPLDPASAPSSPYAAAKAASGIYGRMFSGLYGLPLVMLRLFMTYGPGQKAYKVIPYTISSMLGGKVAQISSGNRPVDWVYVEDIMSAFVSAAVANEAIGKEIDIGSGKLIPIVDVIKKIHRMIPEAPDPQFGAIADRKNEQVRAANLEPAERTLKWRPTTTLQEGLSQTVKWYQARGQLKTEVKCGT
jgi:UDP-glucose 4-epimerase